MTGHHSTSFMRVAAAQTGHFVTRLRQTPCRSAVDEAMEHEVLNGYKFFCPRKEWGHTIGRLISIGRYPMNKNQKKRMRRGRRRVTLIKGPKMMERQKALNDKAGSWADDPNFEKSVMDFMNV
jgi:hypothetical protein